MLSRRRAPCGVLRRAMCTSSAIHGVATTPSAIHGVATAEAVKPAEDASSRLNKYSAVITQRRSQGAGQAQLWATDVGKSEATMNQPQVGISSIWCGIQFGASA